MTDDEIKSGKMTKKINCETCYAFRICPQKPKRENYTDENKYLIDLECGVWDCKLTVENLWKELTYARAIIKDLLDNSDEYARQRAIDFLKEVQGDNN